MLLQVLHYIELIKEFHEHNYQIFHHLKCLSIEAEFFQMIYNLLVDEAL